MTDTALTTATNNLPSDLNQLTVELKFYINQWGQNTIEIGKRLIAAKELVGHGNFGKWLDDNFNLKQSSAQNFMNCAKRFGNSQTFGNLNYSTMLTLLALPEGEVEKFIAEQAENGNPIEDMSVRELQAKVAKYKAELEKKNSEVTDLFAENKKLQEDKNGLSQIVKDNNNQIKELANEKGQLEKANLDLKNQLKNQKPTEKIVAPADYDKIKNQLAEKQKQIAELESQLSVKDTTIEVKQTVELDKAKKELADLQTKLDEYSELAVIVQTFESISKQIDSIHFAGNLGKALAYYEKNSSNDYRRFLANVEDFYNLVKE